MLCQITHTDTCSLDHFYGSSGETVMIRATNTITVSAVWKQIRESPDLFDYGWSAEECQAFDAACAKTIEAETSPDKPFCPTIGPYSDTNPTYAFFVVSFQD